MKRQTEQPVDHISNQDEIFDPSGFQDPVAQQTEWTPIPGGTNFRTHKLVNVHANRMEFRTTLKNKMFFGIIMVAGLGIMIGIPATTIWADGFSFDIESILWLCMPAFAGFIIATIGGGLLYFFSSTIVFDQSTGYVWKGRTKSAIPDNSGLSDCLCHIENIHAIQLLSEKVKGQKTSYFSFELNLILKDGKRINIIDHGDKRELLADAETLSGFLNIPAWNAM